MRSFMRAKVISSEVPFGEVTTRVRPPSVSLRSKVDPSTETSIFPRSGRRESKPACDCVTVLSAFAENDGAAEATWVGGDVVSPTVAGWTAVWPGACAGFSVVAVPPGTPPDKSAGAAPSYGARPAAGWAAWACGTPSSSPPVHFPSSLSPFAEENTPSPLNNPLDWLPSYFEPSAQTANTWPG